MQLGDDNQNWIGVLVILAMSAWGGFVNHLGRLRRGEVNLSKRAQEAFIDLSTSSFSGSLIGFPLWSAGVDPMLCFAIAGIGGHASARLIFKLERLLFIIFLRGKCGFCGTRISWRYPLIELLTGLIAFWLFPESLDPLSLSVFGFHFTVACIFICHFFIDLDHQLLLDSLNLYLLAIVFPYVFFIYHWNYWAIGGAIGFGGTLLVTWLFYKIRGQIGLGGGDIKLYGILGLLLGPMGIVFNIFLSCFVGALVGLTLIALKKATKDKPLPFGPSILVVAAFQIYFPELAYQLQSFLF